MIVKSFKTYVKKICMVRMMEGGGGSEGRGGGRGGCVEIYFVAFYCLFRRRMAMW